METFISGETKGEPFFSLTSSPSGCILLRSGLVGGIVVLSSGSYKMRNLELKIFNMFGQLVLEKFDKRLYCLFLSICMCKNNKFLLCFVSFFHCIPPSSALGGTKQSSFLLTGDLLCTFYLLNKISAVWTWRYSLIFSVLALFFFWKLLCFVFLFWPPKIYFCKLLIHNLFLWKTRSAHFWSLVSP